MDRPPIPQRSSFSQIQSFAALAGLSMLLVACGGDSGSDIAGADPSDSSPTDSSSASSPLRDPAAFAAAGGPFGQNPDGYTLTFLDNFDGDLDRNLWNTQRTDTADSTPNFATRNGLLKIWPERGRNGAFFSRTLDTEGRFAQRYGYFETEARLPRGQGVWPAFWLYTNVGGVHREIDVMEAYPSGVPPWSSTGPDGVPSAVMYAPVVWTRRDGATGYAKVPTPDLSASFHRYGVKWEPKRITFYFDGQEVLRVDAAISEPMYMLLDLKFGSDSGEADERTPTGESNSLEINYVKVWQFK